MQQEFQHHIETHFPELGEDPFLVACSGGLDSVVLVHLCNNCKLKFAIAHCNFGLRGGESDMDEAFVIDLAKALNIILFVTRFDTTAYAKMHKVSIQVAARELRYAWFNELLKEKGLKKLVTAHHADDNLETFLINLSRGTGLQGLLGIPEKTASIARPLLPFSREAIFEFAKREGIAWREDSSNLETKYLRNNIRHKVIPLLKDLNPDFLMNHAKTTEFLSQSNEIIQNHIQSLKATIFKQDKDKIRIEIAHISILKPLKGYLYELFKSYGFTEWDDVEGLLTAISGKSVRSLTHRLWKDRDFLLLEEIVAQNMEEYPIAFEQGELQVPLRIVIEEVTALEEVSENILYVDKKTLKYPMTVRKWKTGDYFYPLGMQNKKKLSKFFKDEKISVLDKQRQWLLCSQDQIIWVIGKRGDDRFKVTKETKNILKFSFKE